MAVGHVTQMSLVPPGRLAELAGILARAGVAVTVLPATDLYLMGRTHTHAVPRGVVPTEALRRAGVTCSVATNNVLNPFTPYGDANLLRMANLYANVCQVSREDELAACLGMVTGDAARLMRVGEYGIRVGAPADMVLLDARDAAGAVAGLAQPLWGMKGGRVTFTAGAGGVAAAVSRAPHPGSLPKEEGDTPGERRYRARNWRWQAPQAAVVSLNWAAKPALSSASASVTSFSAAV